MTSLFVTISFVSCVLHLMQGLSTREMLDSLKRSQGKSLVLVGGNLKETNAEVYDTIVNMAGGKGRARIGIVTSAADDPTASIQYYSRMLVDVYGAAEAVHINVSIWDSSFASSPDLVTQIQNVTGFFFGGGDQARVVQSMYLDGHMDSPVLAAIREQFNKGAVIAGTSAGAACHTATVMVTGTGHSWEAVKNGAMTSSDSDRDLLYVPQGGLAFLDGYIIDVHFATRGREGRLIRLLSDTRLLPLGTERGFGIDENTALVITHAGTAHAQGKVIGESGITFVDITSSFLNTSQPYFSIHDVYLTYLTHGDGYNLHTHDVAFAPDKIPLQGSEHFEHALSSESIFNGTNGVPGRKAEFVRVAESLFDARLDASTFGTTFEQNPRFRVDMSRNDREAVGYAKRVNDFESDVISYKNMKVAIQEG